MKQYHDLLQLILDKGTWKDAARENMPRTKAIFGHQMRFDLSEGFPMVNTKNVSFKNIVVELLWFLKGDTNIKYLVDNGCNIWNEDAYNYYEKLCKRDRILAIPFSHFVEMIKTGANLPHYLKYYTWGDCGKQYGQLWRNWITPYQSSEYTIGVNIIDQISTLIKGLKTSPEGRRHILTSWNPATLDDMALNACHVLAQFNCRKLTFEERINWAKKNINPDYFENLSITELTKSDECPKYYLDCQLYQRSADSLLGVPYNIASYVLLTEMLCQMLNFAPGDFIHTFGDVHIYENHILAVKEQLARDVDRFELPKLDLSLVQNPLKDWELIGLDNIFQSLSEHISDFKLKDYQHYPKLENDTSLSTGLRK